MKKLDHEIGTKTVAEIHGMTPEELIEKRHVTTTLSENRVSTQVGMIDGEEDSDSSEWANTNRGLLALSLEIANLPDIDLRDAVAVRNRINEYFNIVAKYGNKPTVAGLGLALNGMDRRRLWEIRTGTVSPGHKMADELPRDVRDAIKKAYKIMENLWENYMQNGKLNPVTGIFLGTNNFGYLNRADHVVTATPAQETVYNEQEIAERYLGPGGMGGSDSDED